MNFYSLQKYAITISLTCVLISCIENKSAEERQSKIELDPNLLLVDKDSIDQNTDENLDTLEFRLINLGLVDIQSVNPNIRVDLKYSSDENFMRVNVYGNLKKAFLQKDVAQRLSKAQDELTRIDSNLFLLVYDAARPRWVQYKMWQLLDTVPVSMRTKFVSNPRNGSVHNYGAAVDLTICDKFGNALDMGAGFDDPREIAYPSKENYFLQRGLLSEEHIKNRQLLRKVMKLAGFSSIQTEWWHFNAVARDTAKKKYEVIP